MSSSTLIFTSGNDRCSKLPEGYTYTFSSSQYDGEDEPTGYQLSNALCYDQAGNTVTCSPASPAIIYSARGEVLSINGGTSYNQSANGFLCSPSSGGCTQSFDSRNDMILATNGSYGLNPMPLGVRRASA